MESRLLQIDDAGRPAQPENEPARRRRPGPMATAAVSVSFTVAVVALAVLLYAHTPWSPLALVLDPAPERHLDFDTFHRSAAALLRGSDIYDTGAQLRNLNPPLLSLLLAPFALLPPGPAYWLFTALSAAAQVAAVLLVGRELRLDVRWRVVAVTALCASTPLQATIAWGQIYGLLTLGIVLGWLAGRRGRPGLGAVLFGVVAAAKPSLAPIVLMPLTWPGSRGLRSRWAGVAAAALATVVGVLAAGPSSAAGWLRMAHSPVFWNDENASFPAVLGRFGVHSAPAVWCVTLLTVAAALCWTRRAVPVAVAPGVVGAADAALFAVVAGSLLAAPIAWANYTVLLWPGAPVLLAAGRWRAALPLMALPLIPATWSDLWPGPILDPPPLGTIAGRSMYCLVLVGFWVALGVAARSGRVSRPS